MHCICFRIKCFCNCLVVLALLHLFQSTDSCKYISGYAFSACFLVNFSSMLDLKKLHSGPELSIMFSIITHLYTLPFLQALDLRYVCSLLLPWSWFPHWSDNPWQCLCQIGWSCVGNLPVRENWWESYSYNQFSVTRTNQIMIWRLLPFWTEISARDRLKEMRQSNHCPSRRVSIGFSHCKNVMKRNLNNKKDQRTFKMEQLNSTCLAMRKAKS